MIKKELNTLLFVFCVLAIVLGVLCVVFAEAFATAIPYVVGALVIIDGIYTLINYFLRKDIALPNNFALAQGLINIVLGILILLSTEFFSMAFGIIVAICLLVYGLFQLNLCINLKKLNKSYIWDIVEAILLIVFAILLLVFSNSAMEIIMIVIGSGMIIVGLYVAIKTIILNKQLNNLFGNKDTSGDNTDGEIIVETTIAKETEDDAATSNKNDNKNKQK